MKTRRRLFALVAAFAVAFGALWPLVSLARFGPPEIPSVICTQSGFQHPGAPAPHEDKNHCPLCVMTLDTVVPAFVPQQSSSLASVAVRLPERVASFTPRFLAQAPPSRAPPAFS